MQIFTKEGLVEKFKELASMGWVLNGRFGNHGGIGNTLEDFLGIEENNLPIPNAAEWELKTQRMNTSSLTTLFHMEPSPRGVKFVPLIFLPYYGWAHKEAGKKYATGEKSFRQTISGLSPTDRGFGVKVDRNTRRVVISFDHTAIGVNHFDWHTGLGELGSTGLTPQPYWGFDDLEHKIGTKLLNCFYAQADVLKDEGKEYYHYRRVTKLSKFSFDNFLDQIEEGNVLVDFDARTGHNHGTKFRLRQNHFIDLYENSEVVVEVPKLQKTL